MADHNWKIATVIGRAMLKRADQLAPTETDADRVRRYTNNPVGFAHDVLGIKPWSRQAELISSVLRSRRVACVSGHKTGKSTAFAILALWFYCSWPGARVVIMAATDRQVNGIIWREIKRLVYAARMRIPGVADMCKTASGGLTDPVTLAEIKGYTAKEAEGAAGVSGAHILYLLDEASGIPEGIFAAVEGNRAGGSAWVCMISNPTRGDGTFYDAFHNKSRLWHTVHIDSRESPNVTCECVKLWGGPMPGLADPGWIVEKLDEWGEQHPLFLIRVAGKFAVAEEAKVFSAGLLVEATQRWAGEGGQLQAIGEGRLHVGVDPAGDGDGGDESGFAVRRGRRVASVHTRIGLSADGHVAEVIGLLTENREPQDAAPSSMPCVVVDAEGPVGNAIWLALREYATAHPSAYVLVRLRSSERAQRQPQLYDRVRDELWACARDWMRDGGAIPECGKLLADLHAPEFYSDARGRLKVSAKRDLRKILGRSPDVGDALTLSCWEPLALRQEALAPPATAELDSLDDARRGGALDPYAGRDAWDRPGRRRG